MGLSLQTDIDLDSWTITPDWIGEYLAAVGDGLPVYRQTGLAPPLALAARTLGQLLDKLSLPAGAIHSLQELQVLTAVQAGQQVQGTAHLERPRRRGNLEFRTVAYDLQDGAGRPIITGKSTVLLVDEAGSSARVEAKTGPGAVQEEVSPIEAEDCRQAQLTPVRRTITQAKLDAYSQVCGDRNPLHWDAHFAAGTQFGGIIAHGMLTLAFISEMLAGAFGQAWLEQGELKVRFKGAARPSAPVETWGRVSREESCPQGRRVDCAVGLRHSGTGEELIGGSASVVLPHGRG